MGTDRETLYRRAMEQGHRLRAGLTRRRMLQVSAAAAAAAGVGIVPKWARSSETHGPGYYADEALTGEVKVHSFAGQRWGLPCEGVIPTFKERFPNIDVEVITEPVNVAYNKMQVLAASKTDSYNAAICDHNIMPAIGLIGTPANLDAWLAEDQGWTDDYFNDVPPNITVGYRVPQTADGHTGALACDSNTKLMYYRKDKLEEAIRGREGAARPGQRPVRLRHHRPARTVCRDRALSARARLWRGLVR